jgi:hypothetical protein
LARSRSGSPFKIKFEGNDTDDLKKAVKEECSNDLARCDAARLKVYDELGTGVPEGKEVPLNSWDGVPKDTTGPNPLHMCGGLREQAAR